MIYELDLLWLPNFIVLGIYFIFGPKFSWNEGIDTCFNVELVLLGRNFDFLGGYLVVTAHYLVVAARYCSLFGGYWWLLLVTACYCSFPLLVWTGCRWCFVENSLILGSYVKLFWIFSQARNTWLLYSNKFLWIMFLN